MRDAGTDGSAPFDGGTGDAGNTDGGGVGTRVVLFGGVTGGDGLADTWTNTVNATLWSSSVAVGPGARWVHGMARFGSSILLFGGFDGSELGDTWVYSGGTWTQPSAFGPSSRGGHCMATLSDTQVVMFGGYNGQNPLGDTWIWSGTAWSKGPNGPQARYSCAMSSLGSTVVLFGGQTDTQGTPAGDTWTFDGTSWQSVAGAGPAARYAPAMATFGRTVVMFGGSTGNLATDTWTFDGASWTNHGNLTGPSGRIGHAMATFGNSVLLYGGGGLGDTWVFDGTSWTTPTEANTPGTRNDHAMATLP